MVKINIDTQQRIKTIGLFFIQGYKLIMATLLAVFVPQRCPESPSNECSIIDNFTSLTAYNTAVLIFNFATLLFFIIYYIFEYYRENWCIEYLDIDKNKADIFLKEEIKDYPNILSRLLKLNKLYFIFSVILLSSNFINFVLSGVLVYNYYYLDYKSITVFATYLILIGDKLLSSIFISRNSFTNCIAESAYMTEPVVFNRIDTDYRINKYDISNESIETTIQEITEKKEIELNEISVNEKQE